MPTEPEESSETDAPVKPAQRDPGSKKKKASTKKRAAEKAAVATAAESETARRPSTEASASASATVAKKKKKKKKAKAIDASPSESAAEDAEAPPDETPAHDVLPGEGTAEGRRLREAYRAFEAGDHMAVRKLTKELADAKDSDVRVYAAGLARRVSVDPFQIGVVAVCFGVLVWIVYTWIL